MESIDTWPGLTAQEQDLYDYLVFCHFEGHFPLHWQIRRRLGLASDEEAAELLRELAGKGLLESAGEAYKVSGT